MSNSTEANVTIPDLFLYERNNWGLLQLTGADRLRFLHNQSTNNINILKPGQGCDTVLVNSTGRTLDLVTVYVRDQELLLLVSPQRREFLMQWLDRFIFPFDQVSLSDVSDQYSILSLIGQESSILLEKLGFDAAVNLPENSHVTVNFDSTDLLITVGNGLKIKGYNLILPLDKSADLCSKIRPLCAEDISCLEWEKLRILQGRPAVNKELTEDYNPLEAGLWDCISFNKGCYIGQETIARLNTYQGVKTRLWGLKLTGVASEGETISLNGEKIGILTSFCTTEKGHFGLGYIKTKAGGSGLQVEVGNVSGFVVAVPFIKHEYYQPEK
jgi:tRNA-modifying protein YgfZ